MSEPKELLAKSYEASLIESKWREIWDKNKTYEVTEPLSADFAIALPPPNVTGELHMGHALNDTLQDILIRYNRMNGKKSHWQIGCDHAGIGTQIVVEKQLAKEGKTKYDLGREEFEKRIWEWTEKHLGRIEDQMRLLGFSPDWSKSKFTLDEDYVEAVRKSFFEYFKQGLIYKGTRLINWCPKCLTSISDLEVVHEERGGKLYKIKYKLLEALGGLTELVVATSRPETLFGDVAVAINPKDQRYSALVQKIEAGHKVLVELPLTGKQIPVITSDAVLTDFGTGALKITPAHDFNDQEITKTWNANPKKLFNLEAINIFNEKAHLLPLDFIPQNLHGKERFKARELTIQQLQEQELLLEEEKYSQAAALHDRCGTVIEPYLSPQWFVFMKPLAKTAIDALKEGQVKFYPERYGKTYLDWLENIQDWCISRQLWWGHPIPVWTKKFSEEVLQNPTLSEKEHEKLANEFKYIAKETGYSTNLTSDRRHSTFVTGQKGKNEYVFQYLADSVQVVLLSEDLAFEELLIKSGYTKETDVLDTWFSSALWPFATQGWPAKLPAQQSSLKESKKPWTSVLITAREIINLWVSRMIYSSLNLTGHLPFTDILIHPVIQTPDGKRMSKSKGNAIDPIELVNKYGADASRLWYCSVGIFANQDTRFPGKKEKDENGNQVWTSPIIEQKRRFVNKLWNATKFVLQNTQGESASKESWIGHKSIAEVLSLLTSAENISGNTANIWIVSRWNEVLKEAREHLSNYRFAEYGKALEDFVWDDYCDWYLELAKLSSPTNSSQEVWETTQQTLLYVLEQVFRALHPVTPFVTEELWQVLTSSQEGISKQPYPEAVQLSEELKAEVTESQCVKYNLNNLVEAVRSIRQKILGLSANIELGLSAQPIGYLGEPPSSKVFDSWENFVFREINWTTLAKVDRNKHSKKYIPFSLRLVDSENLFSKSSYPNSSIFDTSGYFNVDFRLEVPDNVDLKEREHVLQKDLDKRLDEKSKLEARYKNPGFFNNAPDEVKQEMETNLQRLEQEIHEFEESIQQIKDAETSAL